MPVSMPGVVLDLGLFQSGQEPGTIVSMLARTRKNDIGSLVWDHRTLRLQCSYCDAVERHVSGRTVLRLR